MGIPNSRGDVIGTAVKNELSRKANPKLLLWGRHEQKRSSALMTVNNLVRIFQLIQS